MPRLSHSPLLTPEYLVSGKNHDNSHSAILFCLLLTLFPLPYAQIPSSGSYSRTPQYMLSIYVTDKIHFSAHTAQLG